MPLMPSAMPPLFIKAVKDICSMNTFEKLFKRWSKLLTFRLYNTIVSRTTNYLKKDFFFRLVTSVGQRKNSESHEESNLTPSDLRSGALALSHRDSSVSEVCYEVHMTRVLHTARISNDDSMMSLLFLSKNITLSTLLIQAVCRTRVVWTS